MRAFCLSKGAIPGLNPDPDDRNAASCALLIFSCDRYADLWPAGIELFNRYWPDCPWKKYLASDTRPAAFPGFQSLGCSDHILDWSTRLAMVLSQIPDEYVLMLLDDFFLQNRVDTAQTVVFLEEAVRCNAPCLRLVPHRSLQKVFLESEIADEHTRGLPYRTSTQASIWRKDRLLSLLVPGESIWEFEANGSSRSEKWPEPFLAARRAPIDYIDVLSRGKWMPRGLRLCEKEGVAIDLAVRPAFSVRDALRWRFGAGSLLALMLRFMPSSARLLIRRWRPRVRPKSQSPGHSA